MTRGLARLVARSLVGVLLFAQMAIAAYACPGRLAAPTGDVPMSMPVPSLAVSPDESGAPGAGPSAQAPVNCAGMAGPIDASAANLCAEHCKYGQQSDQASSVTVPAALLTALYLTPQVPDAAPPPRPVAASLSALVAASPTHAILHCVFRL